MVLSVTFSPCHKINSPFLPFKPLLLYVCQSFPNSKTDDTSLLKSNKERLKKRKLLFVQLFPQCCRIPLIWCTSKVFKDIDPYLLKLFNLKKKKLTSPQHSWNHFCRCQQSPICYTEGSFSFSASSLLTLGRVHHVLPDISLFSLSVSEHHLFLFISEPSCSSHVPVGKVH